MPFLLLAAGTFVAAYVLQRAGRSADRPDVTPGTRAKLEGAQVMAPLLAGAGVILVIVGVVSLAG